MPTLGHDQQTCASALGRRGVRAGRRCQGRLAAITALRAEDPVMRDRDRCREEAVRTVQDRIEDLAENGARTAGRP